MHKFDIRKVKPYLWLMPLLLYGCAASPKNGSFWIGLDVAEVLGKEEQVFTLADGSKGKIRSLQGQYSLKLEGSFRVIDVPQANNLSVQSTGLINGEHVIVVAASENYCRHRTWLFVVAARETSAWNFGDCQSKTNVVFGKDTAMISETISGRSKYYTYAQGKVYHGLDLFVPSKEVANHTGSAANSADGINNSSVSGLNKPPLIHYRPSAPINVGNATKIRKDQESGISLGNDSTQKKPRQIQAPAPTALPSAEQIGLRGSSVQPAYTVRLGEENK